MRHAVEQGFPQLQDVAVEVEVDNDWRYGGWTKLWIRADMAEPLPDDAVVDAWCYDMARLILPVVEDPWAYTQLAIEVYYEPPGGERTREATSCMPFEIAEEISPRTQPGASRE